MTSDAMYLIDIFRMQLESLKWQLTDPRIRKERFDKFSYSAWAIQETLDAIDEYDDGCLTVSVIYNILAFQREEYDRYYRRNKTIHYKYKHARNIASELLNMASEYLYGHEAVYM